MRDTKKYPNESRCGSEGICGTPRHRRFVRGLLSQFAAALPVRPVLSSLFARLLPEPHHQLGYYQAYDTKRLNAWRLAYVRKS